MLKVIIPAAGEGRRLRPHTHIRPKVLIEVAGKPILGHILDRVLAIEPDEVCVVVGQGGDQVTEYLESSYRYRFRFIEQEDPRGLGDAIHRARACFDGEPVLVLLGDTIVEMDLAELVAGESTIGVREVADPRRFGVVKLSDGRITRLVEKPDRPPSNLAIVGVYFIRDSRKLFAALDRLIADGHRTRGEYQLTDALQLLIEQGETLRVREVQHWLDCGTADALLDTNRHLLRRDGHARPRPRVVFIDPVYVDDEATVAESVVGPNVSIGAGATVRNSVISDSIINRDARVEGALLARSIIGRDSVVCDLPRRLNLGDSSEYRVMPDEERPDR
ncbi:MAG TPA: nucleotidyl transferase [candidate division WOR-3 bacterium]|mgnify:CR=1 FL=1|uniref:Nucleotidyl transferase n=1 Tax=candidate division WOR-3 bacterium TaxID=2052148 RepID=A0A7V0XFP9_UNCW3|nr:nucleotidyl transferase [candidate division WOR-3 bacterium]